MNIFVDIALFSQIAAQFRPSPHRPVMAVDQAVRLVAKHGQGLVDAARPQQGIAHLRPARRHQIMHRLGADLGHA